MTKLLLKKILAMCLYVPVVFICFFTQPFHDLLELINRWALEESEGAKDGKE